MAGVLNAKERLARRLLTTQPQPIAEGVWMVCGGFPMKIMNVFFIRDGSGVLAYGAARGLGVPVLCHPRRGRRRRGRRRHA